MEKNCTNCKFNKYDRTQLEFICQCEESDNYSLETECDGSCEEFTEKDPWIHRI